MDADDAAFLGAYGQDRWFAEVIRGSGNFFVEVGAGDGLRGSNSFWFEQRGWSGLCVESRAEEHRRLVANRSCLVSDAEIGADRTLGALLDEVSAPAAIDFLSIRGSVPAKELLEGLGWGRRLVRAIGVEHHGDAALREEVKRFLTARGYHRCGLSENEDYYLLFPEKSRTPVEPELDLFAEFHHFGHEERDAEIEGALRENLELEFVRRLYLLGDEKPPPVISEHPKCELVQTERRQSIQEIFSVADELGAARCKVLLNSDIVLDDNCRRLPLVIGNGEFFALRRVEADGRLNPRGGLDAWCWVGACRVTGAEFEMGRLHCDLRLNRLAFEAYQDGFSCPSRTFTTHHRHASQIRPGTSNLAERGRHAVPGDRQNIATTLHPFQIAVEATTPPDESAEPVAVGE